jgi:uncharacterized DUF497 family protein
MTKGLRFEWDERKALSNKAKHGIAFPEACQVFGDQLAITIPDPSHGAADELREVTIGSTGKFRIVVVSHVTDDGTIRVISARKATSQEIKFYNER